MSDSSRKYSVIELADLLNVPRTTINDWLVRYPLYIGFQMQGKRKVYTEDSVNVLKEISELRNKGLSSFEIEEELAKKHPIHAELSLSDKPLEEKSKTEEASKEESTQLILRNSMTEMGEMIRNTLLDMNRRIDELEKCNSKATAKADRWYLMTFAMLILLVVSGVYAAVKIQNYLDDNARLQVRNVEIAANLKEAGTRLVEKEESFRILQTQKSELESGLEKQKKEFAGKLDEMRRSHDRTREAEILEQRNKFAEEKLNLLKGIEEAKKSREELALLLAMIQEQNYQQAVAIKNMSEAPKQDAEKPGPDAPSVQQAPSIPPATPAAPPASQ